MCKVFLYGLLFREIDSNRPHSFAPVEKGDGRPMAGCTPPLHAGRMLVAKRTPCRAGPSGEVRLWPEASSFDRSRPPIVQAREVLTDLCVLHFGCGGRRPSLAPIPPSSLQAQPGRAGARPARSDRYGQLAEEGQSPLHPDGAAHRCRLGPPARKAAASRKAFPRRPGSGAGRAASRSADIRVAHCMQASEARPARSPPGPAAAHAAWRRRQRSGVAAHGDGAAKPRPARTTANWHAAQAPADRVRAG